MSVNIHLLRGGKRVKALSDVPKDAHWQIQFLDDVAVWSGYDNDRCPPKTTYSMIYVYDDKAKWEQDVLKLYDEDHNRADFIAVAVGSQVRPQTTITLDYGPPAAPSRTELLRES